MNKCLRWLTCMLIVLAVFRLEPSGHGAETGKVAEEGHGGKDDGRYGGIYRVPLLNNPKTLDPAHEKDIYSSAVVYQLFDGLVQFSPDLFVVPALAENWQVEENGKVYRFFLRENALFHNGRRVVSNDVIFSLSRVLRVTPPTPIHPHLLKIRGAKEYAEHRADHVSGLKVLDDHTLLIHLEEPHVPFLVALGMHQAMIVPPEEVMGKEDVFSRRPVGTGPFKFVSWEDNEIVRLQRFPQYFSGPSYLDGVHFIIYPGIHIDAVLDAFKRGQLEEMPVFGEVREKLKGEKGLQWVHRPSLSLQFYGINCRNPNLSNPDLRRALSAAIDRLQLVERAYGNQYEPALSIVPPGLPGYSPKVGGGSVGPAEDLRRLSDAHGGKLADQRIEVASNSQSPLARAELSFVGESWAKLGITLEPKFIPDWTEFEKYLRSDSLQVYRYVWYADMPDPDGFLQPLFSADSEVNFMRYRDEKVNEMLHKARGITDPFERARTYQAIEQAVSLSSPIIPLINLSIDFVYQPNVKGVQVSALGAHTKSFYRVWLDPSVAR